MNTEPIDNYILLVRKTFSSCSIHFDDFKKQILEFLSIESIDCYNFVIDSFYTLEDTQLAKSNYREYGLTGPTKNTNFGEVYLRLYGLLNACYLQKQAILTCFKNLGLKIDSSSIHSSIIFDYRKIFAAHTTNVGTKDLLHSYILDRHALLEDKIKGYSANSINGHQFKEAKLNDLLDNWDNNLVVQLRLIAEHLLYKKCSNKEIEVDLSYLRNILRMINDTVDNKCKYLNIWDSVPLGIKTI